MAKIVLIFSLFFINLSAFAFDGQPEFLGKNEVVFGQKTYRISAIDPTGTTNFVGRSFPGLRGANQMIIYTPNFGKRTNTNEFGSEAIVINNVVVSISGADSIIPKNGFVISTHGIAKQWLNENIIVGSKVFIDKDAKLLNVYLTSESFIYCAKEKIKEAHEMIEYYRMKFLDYDYKEPLLHLKKAKEYVKKAERSPRNVQKFSSLAIEEANDALTEALPYDKNELKGVWIRPSEKTKDEIIRTLDRFSEIGIDNVFIETYFHGFTIFPSYTMERYGFNKQNPIFMSGVEEFDPLKIWVEEAHKRNIKVHIWFETFYIGNKNPADDSKNIVSVKPNWANTTKKNYQSEIPTPSYSEHNGYFLDPANPDVQNFLAELLEEIINNYKPDGINLDYIRYPQSIGANLSGYDMSNWGYTKYARDEFKTIYGLEPVDIASKSDAWPLWNQYRQDKITDFVKRINLLTRKNGTMLTTVIFPDRRKALETKQQNWKEWAENNYIDGLTPLILTCDAKTAKIMLQDVMNNKSRKVNVYAGLFITFMSGAEEDLIRQIHEARKIDAKGVILFDWAHLSDKYVKTLDVSVFNKNQNADFDFSQNKQQYSRKSVNKRLFKKK